MSYRLAVRDAILRKDHAGFDENFGSFYNVGDTDSGLIVKVFNYWNASEADREYEQLQLIYGKSSHIRYPRPVELIDIGSYGELGPIGAFMQVRPTEKDQDERIRGVVMERLDGQSLLYLEEPELTRYLPSLRRAVHEFRRLKIWRSDMKLQDILGLKDSTDVAFVDAHYLKQDYPLEIMDENLSWMISRLGLSRRQRRKANRALLRRRPRWSFWS